MNYIDKRLKELEEKVCDDPDKMFLTMIMDLNERVKELENKQRSD